MVSCKHFQATWLECLTPLSIPWGHKATLFPSETGIIISNRIAGRQTQQMNVVALLSERCGQVGGMTIIMTAFFEANGWYGRGYRPSKCGFLEASMKAALAYGPRYR